MTRPGLLPAIQQQQTVAKYAPATSSLPGLHCTSKSWKKTANAGILSSSVALYQWLGHLFNLPGCCETSIGSCLPTDGVGTYPMRKIFSEDEKIILNFWLWHLCGGHASTHYWQHQQELKKGLEFSAGPKTRVLFWGASAISPCERIFHFLFLLHLRK